VKRYVGSWLRGFIKVCCCSFHTSFYYLRYDNIRLLGKYYVYIYVGVETRDGRKYTELEGQSMTMRGINKRFRKFHAASIHVNLIGMLATVVYGVLLGQKLG